MRLVYYMVLFLAIAGLYLTSCTATPTIIDAGQTSAAKVAQANAQFPASNVLNDQNRYLRSEATRTQAQKNSASDEERVIIPPSVRIALKRLVTKDDTIYTHGRGEGGEKKWWATVLRYYRKVKGKYNDYIRPALWNFRFLVWILNKRTPAMMYERLNVISTKGIGDKNYRIYINYLRFYESFKGPTYNPLLVYEPKFTDY